MRSTVGTVALFLLLTALATSARAQNRTQERERVSQTLDRLHETASSGDYDAYFALYDEAAIFIGTDASERWTIAEFKDYARPVFARGRGWTYTPTSRSVYLSEDGNTAWFDEMLSNENLGTTRGTGVLIRKDGDWKIMQYHLTIPVPNQLAREFVARIQSLESQN